MKNQLGYVPQYYHGANFNIYASLWENSPDIFQARISELLGDMEGIHTYLDDILITTNSTFEHHLQVLESVLGCLQAVGFHVNLCKCSFAKAELDYLCYVLTHNGIHPQPKKVEAIMCLQPPNSKQTLRHFLGLVNYYDMWQHHSHILAPLTALLAKDAKFIWGPEQQKAFEDIKNVISQEVLLSFPDFNKPFHIYMDASTVQLEQ